jgi:polyketide synthase PksN
MTNTNPNQEASSKTNQESNPSSNTNSNPSSQDYPIGIFSSVFTGNEAFLVDHVIQGKKIMPGMAYLEMARAAISASATISDNFIITLNESVFVQPLVVMDKKSVEVKVYPGATGEFGVEVSTDQGVHFQTRARIESRQEDLITQEQIQTKEQTAEQIKTGTQTQEQAEEQTKQDNQTKQEQVDRQTTIQLKEQNKQVINQTKEQTKTETQPQTNSQPQKDSTSPYNLDIPALEGLCSKTGPTKEQIYTSFKELGISYGPSHQGIEDIKLGKNCALVNIFLDGSSNRAMALNPGMLDSIIQSAFAFATQQDKSLSVPFAIKSVKIYAALPDKVKVYLVKTKQGVNYEIADYKGNVKLVINGFVSREIDLITQDQLVYYKPIWQEDKQAQKDEEDKQVQKEEENKQTKKDEQDVINDKNNKDNKNVNNSDNTKETKNSKDNKNVTIISNQPNYVSLVKTVFKTAKQLIETKTDKHTIEVHLKEDKPAWQGIIAALKSVSLEYSKISYKLKLGDKYVKLGYELADMEDSPTHNWQDNKTVLITGGMGGLGLIFAQDITKSSTGNILILVGRSELNSAKKDTIKRLKTFGAKVVYEMCDITKQKQVNDLIAKYPNTNIIIHGSGIIKDNFITKKTLGEIDQVLAPKVKGLEYLDQASANLKLDYFITLSSMAGAMGNAGQIDYASANGYMDSYIQNRAKQVKNKQRSGKSISINWPLWDTGGMQISDADRQNMLQVFKIKPLPTEQGLTALKQIIASNNNDSNNKTQALVLFGNKKAINAKLDKISDSNNKDNGNNKDKNKNNNKPPQKLNITNTKLVKEIQSEVKIQAAEHLKMQPNQLDEQTDWAEFGFDSILLSSFVNQFNTQFDLDMLPTALFEATNIELFSQYLANNYPHQMAKGLSLITEQDIEEIDTTSSATIKEPDLQKISAFAKGFKKAYKANSAYREDDIAIVGMSCKIAGANNLEEFWQMLADGKDMVTEIPQDRWNWQAYPEASKWGSFIDDVDKFDSLFFGISPAEAMYMSPEQRLMMLYVWECLENAGCGDDVKGTDTGIFIGCGPSGYSSLLAGMPIQAYSSTGMVPSVGPNRISYLMDWRGPSEPIETACSSSLVAVHRAVEAIRSGHCSQAIAGGVNLLLTPEAYISFTKAGMLCEDGRCKTFSDKANGYVRGEGVGMLMLKPLKDAVRDGNVVHALVKGTAENHGGRTNSLTAPNPKSQSAVIQKAVSDANVDFNRISYIECHGTGTELGDPVEIEGLKTTAKKLLEDKSNNQTCKLGSIKSNIGHLEMAAGVVGLIKVVLQMKHKKIAKSLHCDTINPYIDLKDTPFTIAQTSSDWQVDEDQTRVAGVSSFGFGGVNSHVILEEFQNTEQDDIDIKDTKDNKNNEDNKNNQNKQNKLSNTKQQSHLLIISARNEQSLKDYVAKYPSFIKTLPDNPDTLQRLAYTLQMGRSPMQERLVFVAKSIDEWQEQLDDYLQDSTKANRNIYRGTVKSSATDNLEIGDTQAGKDYIKQLIDTNESGKIAELWVKGSKIDWQALYK